MLRCKFSRNAALHCRQAVRAVTFTELYCRWVGDVAQHRQRDFVNQPRDEFGRPVAGRHGDKPWHEYRPAIAAAEPARLAHPPPPGAATTLSQPGHCSCQHNCQRFFNEK